MAEKNVSALPHKLTLDERSNLNMTGVREVISFDENIVVLKTDLGNLTVHGQHLQLKTLAPEGGKVTVNGEIHALVYEQPRSGGFFRRMFG